MPSAVLDLNNILEQIQTIFQAANNIGASPVDLSNGLVRADRVLGIWKHNPNVLRVQAGELPAVTCWIESKSMAMKTIARTQVDAKRGAEISIKIAGMVDNQNTVSVDEDQADKDIYILMENIELILRANSDLNKTVLWSEANAVTYHDVESGSQEHFRVGIMNLEAKIEY